jgi:hypothetical protein
MAALFGQVLPPAQLRVSPPVEHEFAPAKPHLQGRFTPTQPLGVRHVRYGPALARVVLEQA